MQNILLFGAGKSATCLIHFLEQSVMERGWQLTIAETNLQLAQSKLSGSPAAKAVQVNVEDAQQRADVIRKADVVISLLPPALHFLVASSCLEWKKHLLTASYLDQKIRDLEAEIRDNGLLFLCEMGLDPGIDHMSAMQLIHRIRDAGGRITRFLSHTGGLVSPESDNNPWHYKISWNPRNVVMAGSAGAQYLENGAIVSKSYGELFREVHEVAVPGVPGLAWYPNRDSLSYIALYGLDSISTFIRTTLRYPVYIKAWSAIVDAGLTDDKRAVAGGTLAGWAGPLRPLLTDENRPLLEFLGLFDEQPMPGSARTSADVLQHLLETRLAMAEGDKDMIVMMHEIGYTAADGGECSLNSSLVVHGEDPLRTAMAKTVGLPLGIAAILLLEGKIGVTGVHIPIVPEIYEPVMEQLRRQGIEFREEERRTS